MNNCSSNANSLSHQRLTYGSHNLSTLSGNSPCNVSPLNLNTPSGNSNLSPLSLSNSP